MKKMAFIDMEGVLIPEIWPYLADCLGLEALKVTTRDIPDYQALMKTRIDCLKNNQIDFQTVRNFVDTLHPLMNANKFVQSLKDKNYEVNIVSDSFYQLLGGFFIELNIMPSSAYCHHLVIDTEGFISSVEYTRAQGKHETVNALLNRSVYSIAVGDAFNDFSMLQAVSKGFLFSPSDTVKKLAPDTIQVVHQYNDILLALN